jgi:uncharacterized transporter YbjL
LLSFLALAIGYILGKLKVGNFQLGAVLGTLIAGLAVGQFVIDVPNAMKSAFFLMFMFAIGFRTGPEFFRSLRSSAFVQIVLILAFCLTALCGDVVGGTPFRIRPWDISRFTCGCSDQFHRPWFVNQCRLWFEYRSDC